MKQWKDFNSKCFICLDMQKDVCKKVELSNAQIKLLNKEKAWSQDFYHKLINSEDEIKED